MGRRLYFRAASDFASFYVACGCGGGTDANLPTRNTSDSQKNKLSVHMPN